MCVPSWEELGRSSTPQIVAFCRLTISWKDSRLKTLGLGRATQVSSRIPRLSSTDLEHKFQDQTPKLAIEGQDL